MEETVAERVRTFLQENKIATSAFEKKIGVSNGYVRLLKNSPKPVVLERIFDAYPQLSRAWLLAGVGDMYGNGQQHHNVYVNSDGVHLVQVANGDNNNQEISPEELKQENDALKRENDALKKDIGNLEQRIAEKDEEIKFLRSLLAK